jgi:hypothetical protein
LENDPGTQAALGVDVPPPRDWFSPFNRTRVVHPYLKTPATESALHDLYRRLGPDDDPSWFWPLTSCTRLPGCGKRDRGAGAAGSRCR